MIRVAAVQLDAHFWVPNALPGREFVDCSKELDILANQLASRGSESEGLPRTEGLLRKVARRFEHIQSLASDLLPEKTLTKVEGALKLSAERFAEIVIFPENSIPYKILPRILNCGKCDKSENTWDSRR